MGLTWFLQGINWRRREGGRATDKLFVHFQTIKSVTNNLCKTF